MNTVTAVIVLILVALVILAVKRMFKKGACECAECSTDGGGCQNCSAVNKMIASMESSVKEDIVQ